MSGSQKRIDVNCDLGESFGNWQMGNDPEVLSQISTANVACGFHGGDPLTMVRTVEQAVARDVAIGAHPGLPDLLGFGRRVMHISAEDAHAYVLYQAGALGAIARAYGRELHHVKPHGALYVMLNDRDDLAVAVCEAVEKVMESPRMYWPAGAEDAALVRAARERDFLVVFEFYPDLRYASTGRLVLERHKVAVDPSVAVERLARFLNEGIAETVDGGFIGLEAESVCIHGDGPNALEVTTALRRHLEVAGWAVKVAEGARRSGRTVAA